MRFYSTRRLPSGKLIVTAEAAGFVDTYAGEQRPECAELSAEELLDLPGGRQALWAWQNGDDSIFTAERIAFMREGDREEVYDVATRWGEPLGARAGQRRLPRGRGPCLLRLRAVHPLAPDPRRRLTNLGPTSASSRQWTRRGRPSLVAPSRGAVDTTPRAVEPSAALELPGISHDNLVSRLASWTQGATERCASLRRPPRRLRPQQLRSARTYAVGYPASVSTQSRRRRSVTPPRGSASPVRASLGLIAPRGP
jgi:hypothetical protein